MLLFFRIVDLAVYVRASAVFWTETDGTLKMLMDGGVSTFEIGEYLGAVSGVAAWTNIAWDLYRNCISKLLFGSCFFTSNIPIQYRATRT